MLTRKKFEQKDRIIKGVTRDGEFKITVIKATQAVKTAQKRHELSYLNTLLLGRTMMGTMLMASGLKGEERLQVRIEGNGPLRMLIAEATSNGEMRGYVSDPALELDYSQEITLGDAFGPALFSVSKTLYNEAKPVTGTVELVNGNINEDFAYYLKQSEQVDSAISLDVGFDDAGNITEAGGILIQALPGANPESRAVLEENLKNIPQISALLASDHYIDSIMEMAATSLDVRELDRYPVDFFCRCNKDRFVSALAMLQVEDLEDMKETDQELVCHYCNEKYVIGKQEIARMFDQARVKLN